MTFKAGSMEILMTAMDWAFPGRRHIEVGSEWRFGRYQPGENERPISLNLGNPHTEKGMHTRPCPTLT